MHKLLGVVGTIAALAALTGPSFSMGGGSNGGYSGGSNNLPAASSSSPTDDYTVAVRLIKHEQYNEAFPHLLMALASKPGDADILNYLGYTKRMTGDFPASLAYYKRALTADPNHKGAHEYLGELYLQMNDKASAMQEAATLATLCPSGCDERDTLDKKIAAYVPVAGTAPVASGASGGTN
ncbi:MAG: tetratricopeptide repeat protein [Alphaproteobacteria bacterium]|nr:tetratricopeptide repeat protein [Alphaproteobacteria bacterium]MBV9418905.1 tetratricopeptide repeat protein [Alphaproteobacteria bacterium]